MVRRGSLKLRDDIACGLKENENQENTASSPCTCEETIGKFSGTFENMIHNNLAPSQQQKTKNRNLQNRWLLDNIFDSYGNYIFCFSCIKNILKVSGKRIRRLREIKRQQATAPTIKIRKDQILPEQISDIIPPNDKSNILSWWLNLKNSSIVELRSSPKLHKGNMLNRIYLLGLVIYVYSWTMVQQTKINS